MKARVILGPGTHAIKGGLRSRGSWFHDESELVGFLFDRGIASTYFPWATALAGFEFWRPWLGLPPALADWHVPALHIKERYQPSEVERRYWPRPSRIHALVHSHGAQPFLIAAGLGLRINVLITVSSPVRCDVLDQYGPVARKNIGYHLHYYSKCDRVQAAGGLGDGRFGVLRDFDYSRDGEQIYKCDETVVLEEACGHSGLLHEAKYRSELLTAVELILARDGRDDLVAPLNIDVPADGN